MLSNYKRVYVTIFTDRELCKGVQTILSNVQANNELAE